MVKRSPDNNDQKNINKGTPVKAVPLSGHDKNVINKQQQKVIAKVKKMPLSDENKQKLIKNEIVKPTAQKKK